jgi:hypothetical protein
MGIFICIPSSRLICEAGVKLSLVGEARTATWDQVVIPCVQKWGEACEEREVRRTRFEVIVHEAVMQGVSDGGGVMVKLGTKVSS